MFPEALPYSVSRSLLRSDHRYRCTGGNSDGSAPGKGERRESGYYLGLRYLCRDLSVIGARIYYVIFAWDYYKDNLLSIFNTRNGGMAIYGGVIGAFLTLFIYCKTKKISPFRLGDLCVPGLILGQAIGRWGNFMNREVFGEYTDNFLAMRLPIEAVRSRDISENVAAHIVEGTNYIQVHPTFLYESLWNLMILLIMLVYRKHKSSRARSVCCTSEAMVLADSGSKVSGQIPCLFPERPSLYRRYYLCAW